MVIINKLHSLIGRSTWLKKSLSRNFTISSFIALSVVAGIALYVSFLLSSSLAQKELEAKAEGYISSLKEVLTPLVWNLDTNAIEIVGATYSQNELVAKLEIVDIDGEIFFSSDNHESKSLVTKHRNLEYKGIQLGSINLVLTAAYLEKISRQFFWSFNLPILTIMFLLIISNGILLRLFLKKPLREFVNRVNDYASGKQDAFKTVNLYMEMQPLIHVLEEMGDQISRQMDKLKITQQAVDKNSVAIFWIDGSDRLVYANEAACRTLDYPQERITRLSVYDTVPRDMADDWQRRIRDIKCRDSSTFDSVLRRRDGSEFPVAMTANYLNYEEEDYLFFFATDITKRKQAERALYELNEELEQRVSERTMDLQRLNRQLEIAREASEAANQAKTVFVRNISHELRSPLNVILGYAQLMLRDRSLTADTQENLSTICRSGEHLLNLINDIIDLSKIESNRMDLSEKPFNLSEMILEVEHMFKEQAKQKHLRFTVEKNDLVPDDLIGDEAKIRQILVNLLDNAIKYTDSGSVTLFIEEGNDEKEIQTPYLLFRIVDTGHGIHEMEMGTLFDTFVQTQSGRQSEGGAGLGLSISKKLARLMKGDITVRSTLGAGSEFVILLPKKVPARPIIHRRKNTEKIRYISKDAREYKVLVVDDHEENRVLLRKTLTSVGYTVQTARSGEHAIELFKTWNPDAIFMDIRMPGMDGDQTTLEIRALERRQRQGTDGTQPGRRAATVIIALTAGVFENAQSHAASNGYDFLLHKPVNERQVFAVLGELLGLQYVTEGNKSGSCIINDEQYSDTQNRIETIPDNLKKELLAAIEHLDTDRLSDLIERIRQHSTSTAESLRDLAAKYNYREIIKRLRENEEASAA